MAGSIREGGLRRSRLAGGALDPMASVGNLVDVMLVLAVALMLALVTYWNVALPGVEKLSQDATPVDDMEALEVLQGADAGYEEVGSVYRDPESGQLYLFEDGKPAEHDSDQ